MRARYFPVAAFLSVIVVAPAVANEVEKVTLTPKDPAVIDVYSTDGTQWTNVDNTKAIKFTATAYSKCKYMGQNSLSKKSPVDGEMSVAGFYRLTHQDTDRKYTSTVSGTYRYDNAQPNPVQICNDELAHRAGQDAAKRYQLLSKGFGVDYQGAYKATYLLVCKPMGLGFADVGEATTYLNAHIRCKGTPDAKQGKPPVKLAKVNLGPLVKAASLKADPAAYTGSCPKGVAFAGSITATRPGEVKYQYLADDGAKSPEFSLAFSTAGTKPTRAWHRTISPSQGGTGQIAAAEEQNATYDGWQQLRILSPAPMTQQANFRITCGKPPPARAKKTAVAPSRATKSDREAGKTGN